MKKIFGLLSIFAFLFMFSSVANAQTVTSVRISKQPTKSLTSYYVGQTLDLAGMKVRLTKSSSLPEEVSFESFGTKNITISPSTTTALKTEDKILEITVGTGSTAVKTKSTLVVKTPFITNIVVKTRPTEKDVASYLAGEALNLNGLVVTLTKSDGSTQDVAFSTSLTSSWATNGIITTPKNGTALSVTNKQVVIQVANKKIYLPIIINPDLNCVKAKISIREATIKDSMNTYMTGMLNDSTGAFSTRKAALDTAWSIPNADTRNIAVKTAWSTFKITQKSLRDTRLSAVKTAWAKYKTDIKACGATSTESQSYDLF